jgi:kinesin family protein 2/24
VKELAANDPLKIKMSPRSEQLLKAEDNGALEDSDPAQLQSHNEGEISADQFQFHETVSHLQLLEKELLESHTSAAEMGPQWTELDHALLAMTNYIDYDQRAYCKQQELLLAERIGAAVT